MIGSAEGAGLRLEDWIVCNLEGTLPRSIRLSLGEAETEEAAAAAAAGRLLGDLRRKPRSTEPPTAGWQRLKVRESDGVARVRAVDKLLTKENILADLAAELSDLVTSGSSRVVFSLEAVERLSSQLFAILANIQRRCESEGGALRLCRLRPDLQEIVTILGTVRVGTVFTDEAAALAAPWPERPPRPLPVNVLSQLAHRSGTEASAPDETPEAVDPLCYPLQGSVASPPVCSEPKVKLVFRSGRSAGRYILIHRWPYRIGRDETCLLRPMSGLVSRHHAELAHVEGRVIVRDLGSRNGTMVNGQIIRGAECVLRHGDTLTIGPLDFKVRIRPAEVDSPSTSELENQNIAAWLAEWEGADATPDHAPTLYDLVSSDDLISRPVKPVPTPEAPISGEDESGTCRFEVIEGALVVSLLATAYDDELTVSELRGALIRLFERAELPRRVVLSLARVGELGSRAIGVLVAHHLRLNGAGGRLRLAQASPHVMASLTRIHLPMLIEICDLLDDAVLGSWA
jgi:pSer/pThr/pTyr-binding forkhead associated (FHA) protein/anti-anti-sigma regulatory factor